MTNKSSFKYEEAISRLDEITQKLEKGELTLEESLTLFEEGIKLTKICSKILDEAEGKIEILIQDIDGDITIEDFDEFNGG